MGVGDAETAATLADAAKVKTEKSDSFFREILDYDLENDEDDDYDDDDDDDDDDDEYNISEDEIFVKTSVNASKDFKTSNDVIKCEKSIDEERQTPNVSRNLRGLLPGNTEKTNQDFLNHPTVIRCRVEHCYFAKCPPLNSLQHDSNNSPANDSTTSNTLQFSNENRSNLEQLTVDAERSSTLKNRESVIENTSLEGIVNANDTSEKDLETRKYNSFNDTDESVIDDSNNKDYFPEGNLTSTEDSVSYGSDNDRCSVENLQINDDGGDGDDRGLKELIESWKKKKVNSFINRKVKYSRNAPRDSKLEKKSQTVNRFGILSYPITDKTPRNFVSVHDLLSKIKKMQKLINAKASDATIANRAGNREKIPPPKLKRMSGSNRAKSQGTNKVSNLFVPMPNLTKISTPGYKNWRVRYSNNEVQNLGLDDLLLKASELNAENFTKALGRKLDTVKSNFNGKDGSEIVLTIPKSKRQTTDIKQRTENGESDSLKKKNVKTLKLDAGNSFSGGFKTVKDESGDPKGNEEISPRKTGIKVKTVENINEEFKDSLELKRKGLKSSDVTSTDKKIMENKKNSSGKGPNTIDENLLQGIKMETIPLDDSNVCQSEEEENRSVTMTMIQGKTEKQRPAILRNSTLFKKKGTNSDGVSHAEKDRERINKNDDKDSAPKNETKDGGEGNSVEVSMGESQVPRPTKTTQENNLNLGENLAKPRHQIKKNNSSFLLNKNARKGKPSESGKGNNNATKSQSVGSNAKTGKGGESLEKTFQNDKVFRVTSIEQKLEPKDGNKRFVKMVPYVSEAKGAKTNETISSGEVQLKDGEGDVPGKLSTAKDSKGSHLLTLSAFSSILKEILPDKWFLCLDKKHGLQIMKTHCDELLNPTILMSIVIAKCGRVTVNVRGKQLDKCHQLFSNLCGIGNSENKLSLNYVLAILNKMRYLGVCFGCDPALRKYSKEVKSAGSQSPSGTQGYRSAMCPLLVSIGKKRCYPCYRMNESLKKRHRRDRIEEKAKEKVTEKETNEKESSQRESSQVEKQKPVSSTGKGAAGGGGGGGGGGTSSRGIKRNLEDFLEESFSTMKQQIEDELEKNKKFGEREKAMKAQEEVLSFMGLTRKNNLDSNPVRKSKRTKKSSLYKNQQQQQQQNQQTSSVVKKIDQKELEFLEKYWSDINTLFSTSLLFGAYSRTGRSRLREKCRMFHKLLSTWREIVKSNPEWIGGEIVSIPEEIPNGESEADQFEKMDVSALRVYIINSVKEVNRIKHKLRTKNSYFKLLYNKFVKRRMKRPKSASGAAEKTDEEDKKETPSSNNSVVNTPTDLSSDESSREKNKANGDESMVVREDVAKGEDDVNENNGTKDVARNGQTAEEGVEGYVAGDSALVPSPITKD